MLLAISLGACPGEPGNQSRPAGQSNPEGETSRSPDQAGQAAIDFLKLSLKDPGSNDHASLQDAWHIISLLPDASAFAPQIEKQVADTGGRPDFELLGVWLKTDPDKAKEFILTESRSGNAAVLQALKRHQATGREVLLDLDLTNQSVEFNDAVLLLLRSWDKPTQQMLPAIQALAKSSSPNISLRAIGYLISLDAASDEQVELLKQAIRTEKEHFMAAIEAAKISQNAELATAFIPRVKDAPLGEADPTLNWDMQPYFSAYALAYIPGTEARVIRNNLLGAANLDLRWQARFGELMQGHPTSFHEAMLAEGVISPYILKCVAPPEAMHPDLLPWYVKAIEQSGEAQRFQLVSQLSRYNEHASDPALRELVLGLLDDSSSLVRGQAWLLASQFGYAGHRVEAAALLASDTEQSAIKAAAACYLLSIAEGLPESGN